MVDWLSMWIVKSERLTKANCNALPRATRCWTSTLTRSFLSRAVAEVFWIWQISLACWKDVWLAYGVWEATHNQLWSDFYKTCWRCREWGKYTDHPQCLCSRIERQEKRLESTSQSAIREFQSRSGKIKDTITFGRISKWHQSIIERDAEWALAQQINVPAFRWSPFNKQSFTKLRLRS